MYMQFWQMATLHTRGDLVLVKESNGHTVHEPINSSNVRVQTAAFTAHLLIKPCSVIPGIN